MGFFSIKFECEICDRIRDELCDFDFFQVLGDWHDYRIQNAIDAGFRPDSAPVRSIARDRARNGNSVGVSLRLESLRELTGQLRKTSILVSNKDVSSESILDDENVTELISYMKANVDVVSVEVG